MLRFWVSLFSTFYNRLQISNLTFFNLYSLRISVFGQLFSVCFVLFLYARGPDIKKMHYQMCPSLPVSIWLINCYVTRSCLFMRAGHTTPSSFQCTITNHWSLYSLFHSFITGQRTEKTKRNAESSEPRESAEASCT